jgi:hypothetical protein
VRADHQHAVRRVPDRVLQSTRHTVPADEFPLVQEDVEAVAMQIACERPDPLGVLVPRMR